MFLPPVRRLRVKGVAARSGWCQEGSADGVDDHGDGAVASLGPAHVVAEADLALGRVEDALLDGLVGAAVLRHGAVLDDLVHDRVRRAGELAGHEVDDAVARAAGLLDETADEVQRVAGGRGLAAGLPDDGLDGQLALLRAGQRRDGVGCGVDGRRHRDVDHRLGCDRGHRDHLLFGTPTLGVDRILQILPMTVKSKIFFIKR